MSFVGDVPDVSGFDVKLEAAQTEDTLFKMRAPFVFLPILMATGILLLIHLYPLNEQRCHEIRQQLEGRCGAVNIS